MSKTGWISISPAPTPICSPGELATLLSGRYVELSILPLSFREYCQLQPDGEKDALFAAFLQDGGFPYIASMNRSKEKIDMYLEGIYNTIIIKDIEERQRRREADPNRRKVTDIALLKTIAKVPRRKRGQPNIHERHRGLYHLHRPGRCLKTPWRTISRCCPRLSCFIPRSGLTSSASS